jgi:hypothetical protein
MSQTLQVVFILCYRHSRVDRAPTPISRVSGIWCEKIIIRIDKAQATITVSYCEYRTNCERAEMLEKSNARNVAHIRKTGHFFRFVFAEKFLLDRKSRNSRNWLLRLDSDSCAPAQRASAK